MLLDQSYCLLEDAVLIMVSHFLCPINPQYACARGL